MSNQGFSFPPPPPPPPPSLKRISNDASRPRPAFVRDRGSARGRASFRGSSRGRGHHWGSNLSNEPPRRPPNRPYREGQKDAPNDSNHKRNHDTAFPRAPALSRPSAPPAVPSFNASIEHLLPRRPVDPPPSSKPLKPTQNLLGLTPASVEPDAVAPDEDEDEEQRLAQHANTGSLEFEYRGQTASLKTPDELAAWLAERKKRWPTQARVEAAKQDAEERRRKLHQEKKARLEEKQKSRGHWPSKPDGQRTRVDTGAESSGARARGQNHTSSPLKPLSSVAGAESTNTSPITDHRRTAAEGLPDAKGEQGCLAPTSFMTALASPVLPIVQAKALATLDRRPSNLDPDATSSSGSSADPDSDDTAPSHSSSDLDSDSGSDSAPETVGTAQSALVRAPDRPPTKPLPAAQQACRNFAKYGQCKFGAKCRFSHDSSRGATSKRSGTAPNAPKRRSLWQAMVAKEQEDERRRLLEAIIALGERGVFDEGSAKDAGEIPTEKALP